MPRTIVTQPGPCGCRSGHGPRATTVFVALLAGLAAGACAPRRPDIVPAVPAAGLPETRVPEGARVFEIDAAASVVTMLVGRAGAFSGLGHLHVVTSGAETGRIWTGAGPEDSGFEVRVPVREFVVDDPEARMAAGPAYAASVPDDARAGTYRNMVGPAVLDVERYPIVVVRSEGPMDASATGVVHASVVVRDATRVLDLPVEATIDGDVARATGSFSIRQTDFGMTPFSVAGGAIAVADEVVVRFELVARAAGTAEPAR